MHRLPLLVVIVTLASGVSIDARERDDLPLRKLAKRQHLFLGAAVSRGPLETDPQYGPALARECRLITPENELKWLFVHPKRDRFDFEAGDAVVHFARRNRLRVRGHPLVWHQLNPGWLTGETFTRDELIEILDSQPRRQRSLGSTSTEASPRHARSTR